MVSAQRHDHNVLLVLGRAGGDGQEAPVARDIGWDQPACALASSSGGLSPSTAFRYNRSAAFWLLDA